MIQRILIATGDTTEINLEEAAKMIEKESRWTAVAAEFYLITVREMSTPVARYIRRGFLVKSP